MFLVDDASQALIAQEAADAASTAAASTDVGEATKEALITWTDVWNKIADWAINVGIKVIIALVVMFISFKIVNLISKKIYKKLTKKKTDPTITRFLFTLTRVSLKILIMVCLVGYVGIETASISAVIASLGVCLSLAMQGTLSNFAGGLIIIIMRPFKLGDFIVAQDQQGVVEDISLFYTKIVTTDNRLVMIPNGTLANGVIVNNSAKELRRVDIVMSISYSSDVNVAKNCINESFLGNALILKDPKPFVEVIEYGSSSIDLTCRAWCRNADYWNVKFYLLNEIKAKLDEAGIEIPFNQLDVNLIEKKD